MADLQKTIGELMDLDPLRRLDEFAGYTLETKAEIVRELERQNALHSLRTVFSRLYPSQLADLLHELDRDLCEEIFDDVGEEQRLAVMLNLHTRGIQHDLQAAMRSVKADEILDLLSRIPKDLRLETFKLARGTAQVDVLIRLHDDQDKDEFKRFIEEMEPADIADLLEELDEEDRERVLGILSKELQADAMVELQLSVATELIHQLPVSRLVKLFELMAADNIADLLELLEEDERAAVISAMEPEQREEVTVLLSYEEDSAGLIMTPETCSMPMTATVADTRRAIAQISDKADPIFYVYVTDPKDESLIGVVPIIDLVNAAPGRRLEDICDPDVIYTTPDEDQEEVARRFRKYDIWVMPVVDEEKKLIGRITVDDVIDVVHEEADEDLARLVGAPDIEDEDESPVRITRKRLPWLLITMFAGLVNSVIIKSMMDVTTVQAIAIFVPAILAMGGNTGMQSSAVCVRGIALGEEKYSRLFSIVWREVRVGATLGLVCGILSAVTVYLTLRLIGGDVGQSGPSGEIVRQIAPHVLAMVVGIAMFSAMTFASSFGSITPILLHRMGADPAVASGPFVTTSNDLSASMIYFAICVLMFHTLAGG